MRSSEIWPDKWDSPFIRELEELIRNHPLPWTRTRNYATDANGASVPCFGLDSLDVYNYVGMLQEENQRLDDEAEKYREKYENIRNEFFAHLGRYPST